MKEQQNLINIQLHYDKAEKVIQSCDTFEQLISSFQYCKLIRLKLGNVMMASKHYKTFLNMLETLTDLIQLQSNIIKNKN